LFVANFFQNVAERVVELLDDGDMAHGRGGRGAVPVLLIRWYPNHVTRPDFPNRAAFALNPAAAGGDNQGLP
jgi:hypothetical protein